MQGQTVVRTLQLFAARPAPQSLARWRWRTWQAHPRSVVLSTYEVRGPVTEDELKWLIPAGSGAQVADVRRVLLYRKLTQQESTEQRHRRSRNGDAATLITATGHGPLVGTAPREAAVDEHICRSGRPPDVNGSRSSKQNRSSGAPGLVGEAASPSALNNAVRGSAESDRVIIKPCRSFLRPETAAPRLNHD